MNTFWLGATHPPQPSSGGRSTTSASRTDVNGLQARLERMEMICEAMWTLLRDKVGVTDDELLAQIAELDLSDGQADGKVARGPIRCPKCQRPNSRRHDFCLYCGELVRTKPFQ